MLGCKTQNESFFRFQFKSRRWRQDAADAAAVHKATLHLQPAVLCSRQQPLIKTFGSYPIKFPSSLRVEKVLNDDNFCPQLPLAVQFILLHSTLATCK